MKKLKYIFLSGMVFLLFFSTCREKESNQVIMVHSNTMKDSMQMGENVGFVVNAFSNVSKISRILIEEMSNQYNKKILLDTALNTSSIKFDFFYTVPEFFTDQTVKITFKAYSFVDDNYSSRSFSYFCSGTSQLLAEYSGFSMYTPLSGKADAFNIYLKQPIFTSEADTSDVDIYVYQDTAAEDATILQRIWKSHTALNFVKANNFNYAKATSQMLRETYLASVRFSSVTNLANDDIILIGFGFQPIGVIKIVAVFDEDGVVNDRYLFNIKFLE